MAGESRNPAPKKASPVSSAAGTLLSLFFLICLSLIISILIEWIGLFSLWKDQGVEHSRNMFTSELQYANSQIKDSFLFDEPRELMASVLDTVDEKGATAHEWAEIASQNKAIQSITGDGSLVKTLFLSGFYITKVFFLRLSILVFSAPLLLLIAWCAMVDGMVERELRKAGNDRESNVIFDFAVSYSYWGVIGMSVLYLTAPIAVNPLLFLLPGALISFFFIRTSFAMYKKYL